MANDDEKKKDESKLQKFLNSKIVNTVVGAIVTGIVGGGVIWGANTYVNHINNQNAVATSVNDNTVTNDSANAANVNVNFGIGTGQTPAPDTTEATNPSEPPTPSEKTEISEPSAESPSTPAPQQPTSAPEPTEAAMREPEENAEYSRPEFWETFDDKYGITLYWQTYRKQDEIGTREIIIKYTDPEHTVFHSLFESYVSDNELNDDTDTARGIWPSKEANPENDHSKRYDFFEGGYVNSEARNGTIEYYDGITIDVEPSNIKGFSDIRGVTPAGTKTID